jgi:hypothetical protein
VREYSAGTPPSPQAAAIMVGIAAIAAAAMALWWRDELYLAFQWVIRYPRHGVAYALVQIVVPAVLAAVGIAMVLCGVNGW